MPYLYATEDRDYSDLAAGRVLEGEPGQTAFPVRLATEVFQRCQALRARSGLDGPCTLYDPCCGGGYLLTCLGFLHRAALARVVGSDVDPGALRLAERNLSLLTPEGLAARERRLAVLHDAHGKQSHADALSSVPRLRAMLLPPGAPGLNTLLFRADALNPSEVSAGLGGLRADVVVADLPYGRLSSWREPASASSQQTPAWRMLESLRSALAPGAVVAVAADKGQKVTHEAYRRLDHFQIGKRRVVIVAPDDSSQPGRR
jgi:hypothetical protein